MSENLDLVRSIHADWERGDFRRVDWAHVDIEFVRDSEFDPDRTEGIAGTARLQGSAASRARRRSAASLKSGWPPSRSTNTTRRRAMTSATEWCLSWLPSAVAPLAVAEA